MWTSFGTPAQRDTRYRVLRTFTRDAADEEGAPGLLDAVADADAAFGSYAALTREERFRYKPKRSLRLA